MTFALLLALSMSPHVVRVVSVDRVVAFSEDGRSALVHRVGAVSGGSNSQAWLLLGLDGGAPPVDTSRIAVSGNLVVQTVDASVCRKNAKRLEATLDKGFFSVANVDAGACARPGRNIVDLRRNLRVRPLTGNELNALIEEYGPGNYVASPDGPLVVRLVADVEGNVVATQAIDTEKAHP